MSISKKILPPPIYRIRRRNSSLRRQKRVTEVWNPIIDAYFEGKVEKYSLKPKKQLGEDEKIIWQYWGQGLDKGTLPEIIQICFNSVDKYKGGYKVIRLSDDTIADYVDIPEFVYLKKKSNPEFTFAFFSDLLRLILLNTYGGVWIDATILLTNHLPKEYADMDYFLFQRADDEKHKKYWINADPFYFCWRPDFKVNMLSSIIFAKKSSEVIRAFLDIMLCFWKKSEILPYYFTFQVIYHEIITRKLSHLQCPVVSDCIPHLIQKKLETGRSYVTLEKAVELTPIHKMTYYKKSEIEELKRFLARL